MVRVTRNRVDRGQWNVLLEQIVIHTVSIEVPLILQVLTTGSKLKMPGVDAAAVIGTGAGKLVGRTIAGLPIIQQIALSQAVSAGQVIVFSGVPVGVTVALATGLIVIVGADAYYILTKDAISDE